MDNPFGRAIKDTRQAFGLTWAMAVRTLVVSAATVALMVWVRGLEHAMNEATDIVLYALAVCGAAVIPIFLWNLWLAPYRNMHERLDKAMTDNSVRGHHPVKTLREADIAHLQGTPIFKLGDAACYWVCVEPHNPVTAPTAKAMFERLSRAVVGRQLPIIGGEVAVTLNALGGGGKWWPSYDHQVSPVALRRYADNLGEVPTFLQAVSVPAAELPTDD